MNRLEQRFLLTSQDHSYRWRLLAQPYVDDVLHRLLCTAHAGTTFAVVLSELGVARLVEEEADVLMRTHAAVLLLFVELNAQLSLN